MNVTKKSLPKIMATVWVVGLILSGLLLSVPPAAVPYYLGLVGIALFPLILGSRNYRIFGIIAVAVSLLLAGLDWNAGKSLQARREKLRLKYAEKTAVPPTLTNKAQ